MATKADFSPEEWSTILQSPFMAATYIMTASPSGPVGIIQEMFAVSKQLAEAADHSAGNALIDAMADEIKQMAQERKGLEHIDAKSAEELRAKSLEILKSAAAIVESKAATDAPAFKQFLVTAARRAAEAAKEGGFLIFGGTQVSDQEKAAIAEVAAALGVAA